MVTVAGAHHLGAAGVGSSGLRVTLGPMPDQPTAVPPQRGVPLKDRPVKSGAARSTSSGPPRHVWVKAPQDAEPVASTQYPFPGMVPGLLIAWRPGPLRGTWQGWVTFAVPAGAAPVSGAVADPVVVSQWLDASLIRPA